MMMKTLSWLGRLRAPVVAGSLALGALSIGAAAMTPGCSTVASHEEYTHYRAVRLAGSERDRLIALQQYIESHPTGFWAEEVSAERAQHEEEVWAQGNSTREGLEWYLRVYPDGEYVQQARQRLGALQQVRSTADEQLARQHELEAQRRAEAEAARRTWVTRAVQYWTRSLLTLRNFGSSMGTIARSNEDFSRAFGQAPAPVCTPEYCIKHYGQLYHIPVPGATRIDRHIDVYLRLVLDRGRLRRAEILLPAKGFSRWYEMENQTVITDEDPEQRMTAINWALDRIQPIIQEVAAGAEQFDFIPEPIPPLQIQAEADTESEPVAPDQAPGAEGGSNPADFSPGHTAGGSGGDPNSLESLLDAAGGADETPTPAPRPRPETQEPVNIVLPIGLISFRIRSMRVVVFGAGEEDYEQGFDGIIIERE